MSIYVSHDLVAEPAAAYAFVFVALVENVTDVAFVAAASGAFAVVVYAVVVRVVAFHVDNLLAYSFVAVADFAESLAVYASVVAHESARVFLVDLFPGDYSETG